MLNLRIWTTVLVSVCLLALARPALAITGIANDPANGRWHTSDKTQTATFLGDDKPESAVLILDKNDIIGQTITVESDGSYIVLQSGDSPHVIFQIPPRPDGTSSKLLLQGGDQPTLFFNDKEQIQQGGKWIRIFSATDKTMRLEIGTATFARVKFEGGPTQTKTVAVKDAVPNNAAPTPQINKDLLHNITANQLSAACNAFSDGVTKKCTYCQGTGKVSVSVETGRVQQGAFLVPQYANREEKCQHCNGTGIARARDDVLIRLAGSMVKDMAFLNKDDPRSQDTLNKTYTAITDVMIGDHRTWTMLTANGKSILAQVSPKLGTTVVALVQVKESIKRDGDHRRYLVRVIGTDKEVYVDDPTLADELKSGHALMGGMVDQPIQNPQRNGQVTTLHGGFLVSPPVTKDYWWWYKDQI